MIPARPGLSQAQGCLTQHPGSAEESRCVLNPEAVFPLEWSREMALLPQGTWSQGPKERGQEGQVAGAGEELEGWAAMRVPGQLCYEPSLCCACPRDTGTATLREPGELLQPPYLVSPFPEATRPLWHSSRRTSSYLLCCGWLRPSSSSPRAETDRSNLCPSPAVRALTRGRGRVAATAQGPTESGEKPGRRGCPCSGSALSRTL